MDQHYILYYLFLEDQKNHPMSEEKKQALNETLKCLRNCGKSPQPEKESVEEINKHRETEENPPGDCFPGKKE